jgi:hypothetical protein
MIDMNSRAAIFFAEANKRLDQAKDGLLKPAEDIVSFSVCKNSRISIENYLKGYLLKNNVAIKVEDTIASLYEKCIGIDPDFKELEMSAIACKASTIDNKYCSNIDTLSACLDTADSVDTFLRKKKLL